MQGGIILNGGVHGRRLLGRASVLGVLATLALLVGQVAVWTSSAGAATCTVKNITTRVTGSDLQGAIYAASTGDTLKIKGVCAGSFTIDKDLTLAGPATLDGETCDGPYCGRGIVLWVDAGNVTLKNLTITNGSSTYDGGGIWNFGTLTLKGSSSVTGNSAEDGAGGIYNFGTLTLNGSSSVSGNTVYYVGNGGGIWNVGTLTLNGSSSVSGNSAAYGGGIFNEGTVTLSGSSSVTGNTAEEGGGIFNFGAVNFAPDWNGTVCGNDPDDWDGCQP